MSNIVGVNHLPYVQEQIKIRQNILGKSNRSSQDQVWANGKTSWLRLVSGVNISDQQVYTLQTGSTAEESKVSQVSDSGSQHRNDFLGLTDYSGNDLAKELMLLGGTLNQPNSSENPDRNRYPLKSSVSNINTSSPKNAFNYGFGGTEFGLKPMPGITSFNSKTYNNGSLREAEVNILAHNKEQFEYIESLYLRLGYTMLLEWGNSMYPKSKNEYSSVYDVYSLSLASEFLDGGYKDYFYNRIEENRKESQGNYDAFLGAVKNFSWEFTKEGTYNIKLILISIGSVIESLKINIPSNRITNNPKSEGNDENANPQSPKELEKEYESSLITLIEALASPLDPNTTDKVYVNFFTGNIQKSSWFASRDVDKVEFDPVKRDTNNKAFACSAIFGETKLVKYIRFKDFLDQINHNLLIYNENGTPSHFSINTSEDLYCYSNGHSISSDPTKMIVKFDKTIASIPIKIFAGKQTIGSGENAREVDLNIEDFHTEVSGAEVGKIMNLYFSSDFLIQEIKANTDKENNLSIQKLLDKLLSTASSLLGGVNKFKTRLSEDQVLEIYDEVSPYNKEKITKDSTPQSAFRIYGVNEENRKGSFITDYNLKTEITKNFSTQIAIGAQAQGTGVGEDSTVFSKWNVGLVDRIIPKKLSKDELEDQQQKILDSAKSPYVKFAKIQRTYLETLNLFSESSANLVYKTPKADDDTDPPEKYYTGYGFPNIYLTATEGEVNFTKFIQIQTEYFTRALSIDAILKGTTTPTIGFLPINLSLTFDGLSGIRIFDKLEINSEFLPSNYGQTLEFIITELDHFFEGNKWFTRIGTLSIPKLFPDKAKQARINIEEIFESTVVFDEEIAIDQGKVGENAYSTSALGAAIATSYWNGKKESQYLNIPGTFKISGVGSKNTGQKAGAGAVSPLITIGELGGYFTVGQEFKNVRMSGQNSSKWIYEQQYDGYYYLARAAAMNLKELVRDARADGIEFTISSAYRNNYHNSKIGGASNSAHKYGGAIDIADLYHLVGGSKDLSKNAQVRATSTLYKWLEENGPKHGWFNPYRLRNNAGINEVWHWEFWGKPGTYDTIAAFPPGPGSSLPTTFNVPTLEESPNLSVK
jgi:hypothetical protein